MSVFVPINHYNYFVTFLRSEIGDVNLDITKRGVAAGTHQSTPPPL
jgi:hypothetical protein